MWLVTADNPWPDGGTNRLRRARMALRLAAATLVLAVVSMPVAGAQADPDPDATRAERDEVRDRQDAVADQVDVLLATDEEISAALDGLEAAIAAQDHVVQDALATADAAARAEAEARRALGAARRDVAVLEAAIVEMAVASYVHPPTADLVQSMQATTLSDALKQKIYLDARAQRDVDLLGLLELAESQAAARADELAGATAAAEDAVAEAEAQVVALEAEQDRQMTFAIDLQDRIDGALAEAAVLADLDAALSEQIAQEQAELIARLPPVTIPPTTIPPTTVPRTTVVPTTQPATTLPTTTTPDDPDDPDPDDPGTTTTSTSTTTTEPDDDATDDEPTTTRRSTPTPPLRTVQGITVHADIADRVEAMLVAASDDGVRLGGSGYRSTQRQIELRRANCGPTEYDIWERPASTCRPPTATPGRSLHEQGRAIDLTYEGRLITSRDNPGFRWLAEHAADHGLFNLPSEPWHWSTSGG